MYFYIRPLRFIFNILPAFISLIVFTIAVKAEDIQLEFNGLDMTGRLEIAQGKSLANDGVTLIVHETLSHGRTPFLTDLQQGLAQQGINTLSITLTLGMDVREGAFSCSLEQDHRHQDGAEEITAWVEWLVERGAKNISLMGVERGASQAVLFIKLQQQLQAEEKAIIEKLRKRNKNRKRKRKRKSEPAKIYLDNISKLVLISPLEVTSETMYADYTSRYKIDLGGNLYAAQKLIESQNEQELIEGKPFLSCNNARFTAAAFIDYYLPKPEHAVFETVSGLSYPVLVLLDGRDPFFSKYETIVSEQLESGTGQLGVGRLNGLADNFQDLSANIVLRQVSSFLK